MSHKRKKEELSELERYILENEDALEKQEYVPLKKRRELLSEKASSQIVKTKEKTVESESEEEEILEGPKATQTLLEEKAKELKAGAYTKKTQEEAMKEEEEAVVEAQAHQTALQSVKELAHGIIYDQPMESSWQPPKHLREMPEELKQAIWKEWNIEIEGKDIAPPIRNFEEMKLPQPLMSLFKSKGIKNPTPIQVQGLPVALSGRDMIGVAFTGSGKTLVFTIPLVCFALEEEVKMPIIRGEGPFGLILVPSRELARQTYEFITQCSDELVKGGYPQLNTMLCIGGMDLREQLNKLSLGVHIVVATPGRLIDLLEKRKITLKNVRTFCLDEADRLVDMGFEEDIRSIMSFFEGQRQTLLFSATMPLKIQRFAKSALVQPIIVNVGRAGAANLDVVQEVEYVKDEVKLVYLLECLQKTPPPVIIFAEQKSDVDDIHEYLLLKGVDAVSIHGGKAQPEREDAIRKYKSCQTDVLVATDIASKGLDFPDIKHVINYDMPSEIENYVHRIGRTGRRGRTGMATTFINKSVDEITLLDLKHLLMEAKQKVPPVLMALDDPLDKVKFDDNTGEGCKFCGGLGHRITECPKLEANRRLVLGTVSGREKISVRSEGW